MELSNSISSTLEPTFAFLTRSLSGCQNLIQMINLTITYLSCLIASVKFKNFKKLNYLYIAVSKIDTIAEVISTSEMPVE